VELPFDLWHLAFVNLIQRRAPPNFEVQSEVRLTIEPPERDEYLRLFSHKPALPGKATLWLRQWMKETKMKQPDIEEVPGFKELFAKSIAKAIQEMPLEERLEGLAPEQRLEGLAPEQRLAGLAPEQVVLALPLELLRALPEEYLRSLPSEIQEQVRKRLQEATH
jgi:hypothetical protein